MTVEGVKMLAGLAKWGFGVGQAWAASTVRFACADCRRELRPADLIRFDHCCGRIVCRSCFDGHLAPTGRSTVLLSCPCGSNKTLTK